MWVKLEVIKGKETGKRFVLDQPRAVIAGRKDDESVPLRMADSAAMR